jgi:UrcA family protein
VSKFSSSIIGAATLALAGLPLLALAGAAHAAPIGVQVSDLNLNTGSGQRALEQRTQVAAQTYCHSRQAEHVIDSRACVAGVQAEVLEKATALRQSQMAAR